MKKILIILLATFFLMLGLASAYTEVLTSGYSVSGGQSGGSEEGVVWRTNSSLNLGMMVVTKDSSAVGNYCTIRLNATGVAVGNGTFIGDNCTIPTFNLAANTAYTIAMSVAGGSSGTDRSSPSSVPPQTSSSGTFLYGCYGNVCNQSAIGQSYNILSITTGDPIAYVFTNTLNYPINNALTILSGLNFSVNSTITGLGYNFTNQTYYIWNASGIFNQTNITLPNKNNTNSSNFFINNFANVGNYQWNVRTCVANSTASNCSFAIANYTFSVGITGISSAFNASTYETKLESFLVNFSLNSGTPTGWLSYNGTQYPSSVTSLGNNTWQFNNSIDIPLIVSPTYPQTSNLYWIISNGGSNLTTPLKTQVVAPINLTLCDYSTPQNVSYVNITFQNETTSQNNVSASLISTWYYWLGAGSINKTLSYTNSAENPSYAFCFTPQNLTMNTQATLQYANSYSASRNFLFSNSLFTNATTNKILYLLPTALGIYSRYVSYATTGAILNGVLVSITRNLGGSSISIGSGVTDNSGLFAIYLDPTATYSYIFSKSGYTSNIFSLTPNSVDTYSVYLGQGSSSSFLTNGSRIATNLSTIITPSNSTLLNNTSYTFGFNVTGVGIIFISENITNSSGQQIGYASGTNGYISTSINTNNQTFILGTYIVNSANENLTFTKTWSIGNYYQGSYSLFVILTSWALYNFHYDYYRILAVVLVLFVVTIGLSKSETIDSTEGKIGAGLFVLWGFSYVGWLTMNIVLTDASSQFYALNQYANQYGIAIVATIAGLYFIIKEAIT